MQAIDPLFVSPATAHQIFGVSRNLFNQVIRPHLTPRRFGRQAVRYSMAELKAIAEKIQTGEIVVSTTTPNEQAKSVAAPSDGASISELRKLAERRLKAA